MDRFNDFNIQKRRQPALAFLHYEDCFYDNALRKYNFKEALHLYLKRNGYSTIVFFSMQYGIHSYEKDMLEVFMNTEESETENCDNMEQQDTELMPIVGCHSGSNRDFLMSPIQPSPKSKFQAVRDHRDTSIWVDTRTDLQRDAQVSQMIDNLLHRNRCVIIVEPSEAEPEFSSYPINQMRLLEDLIGTLRNPIVKENGNHLILLARTELETGDKVPESIDPSIPHARSSSFWQSQYFQDQFLKFVDNKKSNLKFYSLDVTNSKSGSYGSVFVLPPPSEKDIKDAFQYWRIVKGGDWKVDWGDIEDIIRQLSITRGDKEGLRTRSLDQWESFLGQIESISIKSLESIGVYKDDNSKTVKFDKERLINDLKAVKGQQDNMELVVRAINTWLRRKEKTKPLVFMFAGTSGTGKSFTAQNIQNSLKEDGYMSVTLEMNEYSNKGDTWKFLGSATGHIGSDEDAPIFAANKKSKKLVITFNEIEKAHSSLFTTIMGLMEKGCLADGKGKNYDFRQSVIVFTTNHAMDSLLEIKKTLKAEGVKVDSHKFQDETKKILKENGIPNEICGRINWLLVYNTLSVSDIIQIALEQIRKIAKTYNLNINLVSKSQLKMIAEQCAGSNEGARPVETQVEAKFETLFQDAHDSGCFSSNKLYDINDDMQLVESASTELVDRIIIDFE